MTSLARIAVDVGSVRIGVASCDEQQILVIPHDAVAAGPTAIAEIAQIAEQAHAIVVYVGLPLSLTGSDTASTQMARQWASDFSKQTGIVTRLVDERLTTVSATRQLREAGHTSRSSRHLVDSAAAVELLNGCLEQERGTGQFAGIAVAD